MRACDRERKKDASYTCTDVIGIISHWLKHEKLFDFLCYRKCGCGKTSQPVQCGQSQPLVCGDECGNMLNCGEHHCTQICHIGHCEPCKVKIKQGKVKKNLYLFSC